MVSLLKLLDPQEWTLNRRTRKKKPKRPVSFTETNSTGVKLTNNTKNTRGRVPKLRKATTVKGFRLNGSRHMKPSNNKGPVTVKKSNINKSYTSSQKNTSPAPSYANHLKMPEASLPNLIAARQSFFYTPEEIKQMRPYNLVRLPKDHWKYAYDVIWRSNDPQRGAKLKAIRDRISGVITTAQLHAENFPEDEE